MNPFTQKAATFARIKNVQKKSLERDFSYNPFAFLILALFLGTGVLLQYRFLNDFDWGKTAFTAVGTIAGVIVIAAIPLWVTVLTMIALGWLSMFVWLGSGYWILFLFISFGLFLSPSCQLIFQWDKAVILRVGRFHRIKGPGLFLLMPMVDRLAAFIDTRIRATEFSAEKTLTRDTGPVHVDALAFWKIWNAKQAVLEVENYLEAVVLSAQTALRDSIGKHDLADLLSERERLCAEIQSALDAKTNPWGITILSIEFTDIIITQALEDAMSKRAQAEREKQSRVILGTAEVEIARKFAEAAESYRDNPTALHLRAMNMVYEGIRQKGSMIILPSSALDTMNLGGAMGTAAFAKGLEREGNPADGPQAGDGTGHGGENGQAETDEIGR
jgi:regulator of protease activity HflC (stomatin/prohibitin superfamily)